MTRNLKNIYALKEGDKNKIQIALVDDSYLFRSLLHYILTEKLDRDLGVFEFDTPKDFLTSLGEMSYQILIVDINLIENIPNFAQMINALNPKIKVMALSSAITKETFCLIFKSGFSSFLSKESSVEQIIEGIKYFIVNGTYLDPKTTDLAIDLIRESVYFEQSSTLEKKLTPREKEICEYALKGYTNKQIANKLVISKSTVDNHFINLYRKLGITKRTQLLTLHAINKQEYFL